MSRQEKESLDLGRWLWPLDEEGAAMGALAAAVGGEDGGGAAAGPGGSERLEVGWRELGTALPGLAPAVLRLPEPGRALVVLLRSRGWGRRRLVVLGPDGRRRELSAGRLVSALATGATADESAAIEGLLAPLGLPVRRHRRARRALVDARLATGPGIAVFPVWCGRERAGGGLTGAAPVVLPMAAVVAAVATWQVLSLAGWTLLGRGALAGGPGRAWLVAWALLLLTLALVRAGELAAVAALGERAALWVRRRLLGALVDGEREGLRDEGTGRLLGRLLGVEILERTVLGAAPALVIGAGELAGAAVALAHGVAARVDLVLLGLVVAGGAAVAVRHQSSHATGAAAQLVLTDHLVEALAGHRTMLAQGGAGDGAQGAREDGELVGSIGLARRLSRWESWLAVGLPRVWMVAALGAVASSVGGTAASAGASPGGWALSLGGVVLARTALGRLGTALVAVAQGRSAARHLRPLLAGAQAERVADTRETGEAWRGLPGLPAATCVRR